MSRQQIPILLLGFNRPEMLANLVRSLAISQPSHIIFVIDGPRLENTNDFSLVRRSQACTELVTWDCEIETRFRSTNLGLRTSVTEGVTWAIQKYGHVIVVEDDVIVGPDFIPYMELMLERFVDNERIGHINGYNVIPPRQLSYPFSNVRMSRYIESFAWGTWERSWSLFDDSLSWGRDCSYQELKDVVGTYAGAVRWKINFSDTKNDRVNSWAYRWLASLWEHNMFAVSPNINLVNYRGNDDGTHVLRQPRWNDLAVTDFPEPLNSSTNMMFDQASDRWLGRNVFAESTLGVVDGIATSIALEIRQKYRQLVK
jgi:hypothetical protein